MKKFLTSVSLILVFLTLICALALPVSADNTVYSGNLGRLYWQIDSKGTLTISGVGEMDDLVAGNGWKSYGYYIDNVIICEGVTSVGMYAFHGLSDIKSVSIPSTVKTIASNAFAGCESLKLIYISSKDIISTLENGSDHGYIANYVSTIAVGVDCADFVTDKVRSSFGYKMAVEYEGSMYSVYSNHSHKLSYDDYSHWCFCDTCGIEISEEKHYDVDGDGGCERCSYRDAFAEVEFNETSSSEPDWPYIAGIIVGIVIVIIVIVAIIVTLLLVTLGLVIAIAVPLIIIAAIIALVIFLMVKHRTRKKKSDKKNR